MSTLAIFNIKGGVGKTATAVNLSWLAWQHGARVLLWDLDPQGAATWYFRTRRRVKGGGKGLLRGDHELEEAIRGTDYAGLDLVPADFSYRKLDLHLAKQERGERRLRKLLRPIRQSYDYIVLDCAPSISLLSESIFVASDALVVPTIPTHLSLRTLEQLEKHLERSQERRRELRVLPFFCMVDRRKKMHREICDREEEGGRFLESRIPYSSVVEQMGDQRAPVHDYARTSVAAHAYALLWQEIRRQMG